MFSRTEFALGSAIPSGDLVDFSPDDIAIDRVELPWQMTRVERLGFLHLLKTFQPEIALEVGTDKGGSLQAMMQHAKGAISIDINSANQTVLQKMPCFANVEFVAGDSATVLPELVQIINTNGLPVSFILVDGDHSAAGAHRDIEAVLKIVPRQPTCLIMHDSFMPTVRQAILNINWQANPHVHYIETDYVHGSFLPMDAQRFKMVGGLAVALLKPEPRNGALQLYQSHQYAFQAMLPFASNK